MKPYKKALIAVGIVVIVLIFTIATLFGWQGNTDKILRVTDQLSLPNSWQLESDQVRPPRIICLDGGTCPQAHQTWVSNSKISKDEFNTIITRSGWDFLIDGDCNLPPNVSGQSITTCSASGEQDSFSVSIWLSEDSNPPKQQRISLSVRPLP